MFVNDRSEIDTLPCRLSGLLCRVEAGEAMWNRDGQPHMQADLSEREKDGFTASLDCSDTHNPEGRR